MVILQSIFYTVDSFSSRAKINQRRGADAAGHSFKIKVRFGRGIGEFPSHPKSHVLIVILSGRFIEEAYLDMKPDVFFVN